MNYQLIIDSFIGPWAYSKQYVRNVLAPYKDKHVDVKISSLGGNLDHGLDIRQQFIDHGDVTVHLSGFVASAATVIAMGAKKIVINKYAMFLVHKCSNFIDAWGSYNADQMQQLIDELEANKKENDKIDVVLANMYATRCCKKVSEILDILKEGRWMTAQEALELGFVDEIDESASTSVKLNFSPEMGTKFNALGISTLGLTACQELTPPVDVKSSHGNPINRLNMENFKFNTVESLLQLDTITPDNDGYVAVTADQFEMINNRIDSLEAEVSSKAAEITARDAENVSLKSQIENLKKSPGDETPDIEDVSHSDESRFSASELFNSIKSAL